MVIRRNHRIAAATAGLAAIALLLLGLPRRAGALDACHSPALRVYKREGVVELWCDGALRQEMPATFGANPVGPKEREGDERTPEGAYRISAKTKSDRFDRFLAVSYPNEDDRRHAKEKGITNPGGGIGVHGTRAKLSALARIWTRVASKSGLAGVWGPTDGCIGVTNEDVEMLADLVPVGTPITIAMTRPPKTP